MTGIFIRCVVDAGVAPNAAIDGLEKAPDDIFLLVSFVMWSSALFPLRFASHVISIPRGRVTRIISAQHLSGSASASERDERSSRRNGRRAVERDTRRRVRKRSCKAIPQNSFPWKRARRGIETSVRASLATAARARGEAAVADRFRDLQRLPVNSPHFADQELQVVGVMREHPARAQRLDLSSQSRHTLRADAGYRLRHHLGTARFVGFVLRVVLHCGQDSCTALVNIRSRFSRAIRSSI